jgi:two-component system, OmpR family, KDP operon response regulator KdpE
MKLSLTVCDQATVRHTETLRNSNIDANPLIETGDFIVELISRRVLIRGEELRLTSAEFDVLHFLLSNPKRLVTASTILLTQRSSGEIRRTEFIRAMLSLQRKLEEISASEHYLRAESWVVYDFKPGG